MKQVEIVPILGRIYLSILLVVFVGAVVGTPLVVYLGGILPEYLLLIKAWKEILLIVASVMAVVLLCRIGGWRRLIENKIVAMIVVYALLYLVTLVFVQNGAAASLAGLIAGLGHLLYFGLMYIAVSLYPQYRGAFIKATVWSAVLVFGFAVLQVFVLPADFLKHFGYGPDTIMPYLNVDQNPDYVRISSTLRGPNPLGAYAVIILAVTGASLLMQKLPKTRKALLTSGFLLLAGTIALWASYSRSALLGAFVMAGIVAMVVLRGRLSRKTWIAGMLVGGALVGGLFMARDSAFVSNVIMHENPGDSLAENSNDGHIDSLNDGWSRMIRQPFGAGVGSTGSASLLGDAPVIIENQYLFIAHEVGWLGLGLFICIFVAVMTSLWRRRSYAMGLSLFASGAGLAVIGLLLPVWADPTVSFVWWGLAGVTLAEASALKHRK